MTSQGSSPIELIARAHLFHGVAADALPAVEAAAHVRRTRRTAFFFHEREEATFLYLLIGGQVKLVQTSAEGHEVILHAVFPGHLFGGIAALGEPTYPVAAQALADCEALAWSGPAMLCLMERHPAIALNALRILAARLQEVQQRYRELATERVAQRVAHALLRLGSQAGHRTPEGLVIDMPLSRRDLAQMTGTTLYTVSRLLSGWEDEGMVATGRERVVLVRLQRLAAVADPSAPPA